MNNTKPNRFFWAPWVCAPLHEVLVVHLQDLRSGVLQGLLLQEEAHLAAQAAVGGGGSLGRGVVAAVLAVFRCFW